MASLIKVWFLTNDGAINKFPEYKTFLSDTTFNLCTTLRLSNIDLKFLITNRFPSIYSLITPFNKTKRF